MSDTAIKINNENYIGPGVYRHYKGELYYVFGTGRHTETDEQLVAYIPLYVVSGRAFQLQLRPLEMFNEWLIDEETETGSMPRFRYMKEYNP